MNDPALQRLLQAAARAPEEELPNEMPFGFDTRVLAQWRATRGGELAELRHLLRRVIALSLVVIALGGAGAWHELSQPEELGENLNDQYAIADSAIGNAFDQ